MAIVGEIFCSIADVYIHENVNYVARFGLYERRHDMDVHSDLLKVIKDQVLFAASFFSIFGLLMMDSYYQAFGVNYQFLGLSASHILYRGVTLVFFNWMFVTVFLMILIGVFVSYVKINVPMASSHVPPNVGSYVILSIALFFGGYLAFTTGRSTAVRDMYVDTTTLRQITGFHSTNREKKILLDKLMANGEPLLLLSGADDKIIVFNPPKLQASYPRIDMYHIGVSTDEIYSDRTPYFR